LTPQEQYKTNKEKREQRNKELTQIPKWWLGQRDPIARFTLYVAVASIFLAIIAVLQACILSNQLGELQVEQRAWIFVSKIEIEPTAAGLDKVKVTVHFKNVGKTPALVYVGAEIIDQTSVYSHSLCREMQEKFAANKREHLLNPGYYIIPDATYPESQFPDNDLSAVELATIMKHDAPYINGCVVYDDGVDTQIHQTGFWGVIDKSTLIDKSTSSVSLIYSREVK